MLAACFYFYLSMGDDSPGMRVTWAVLKDKGLLSEGEVRSVEHYPGTVQGAQSFDTRLASDLYTHIKTHTYNK